MLKLSSNSIQKQVDATQLYSLRVLTRPKASRLLAKFLAVLLALFIGFLFLPWQQNVRGNGKVTNFDPAHRPQTIEAVIAGRIQKWHVNEGDHVNKGDTIITISEVKEKYFDPQLLERLDEQIKAKEKSNIAKNEKASALQRQIDALLEGERIKVTQTRAKLEAEQFRLATAKSVYERNKVLYDAGNIPLTKLQELEYKYQGAVADYQNAQAEVNKIQTDYQDKISKAESEMSNTLAELYDAQGTLSKQYNDFANTQIRSEQYQVLAPQSGVVVKAMKQGLGETLKEGDAVCTIMPDATDVAIEMYVKANDVPLILKGSVVRVEFDGWPALQFSGWPSTSVGTFGGRVKVIDYINIKPGTFRILAVPDTTDEAWPKQLRVGTGIKGWIMLNNVPIWYEVWRQFNGFPPSLYEEPLDEAIQNKEDK